MGRCAPLRWSRDTFSHWRLMLERVSRSRAPAALMGGKMLFDGWDKAGLVGRENAAFRARGNGPMSLRHPFTERRNRSVPCLIHQATMLLLDKAFLGYVRQ